MFTVFLSNIRKAPGNLQQFSMLALLLENLQQFNKHPVTVSVNIHTQYLYSCLPAVTPGKRAIRAVPCFSYLCDPHSILCPIQCEHPSKSHVPLHIAPISPFSKVLGNNMHTDERGRPIVCAPTWPHLPVRCHLLHFQG
jgi:hypothetical protein